MKPTWRWFGERDPISLSDIAQTGATGIVTALYHHAPGQVWPRDEIAACKARIMEAGLTWDVVESLPVAEAIKYAGPERGALFQAYRASLSNLAAEGLKTVCYNFMPVLDWTRTDLCAPVPGGARALAFNMAQMAAFDIYILGRDGSETDYSVELIPYSKQWLDHSTKEDRERLEKSICAGLPGSVEGYDVEALRDAIAAYQGMSAETLRRGLVDFLEEVVPHAERLGVQLCIHPDDPPRHLLGLPRVVSTQEDIAALLDAVPSPANGLTFCSGSLGARKDNDLISILRRFGHAVPFYHLRNVTTDADGSFVEADHIGGDADMVAIIGEILAKEARTGQDTPFRPDHGHDFGFDQTGKGQPGYSLAGRLRGLSELRGIIAALA